MAFPLRFRHQVITVVITTEGYWVMELKVRRIGNSLGVILPKNVVKRLRTAEGRLLHLVEEPDSGYRLTPYDPSFEERLSKAEDIISRYGNTLHVLAE